MFNVKLTPAMMAYYLPKFSMEALEALADFLEEFEYEPMYIDDIDIGFAEVGAAEADQSNIICELSNGKYLIGR